MFISMWCVCVYTGVCVFGLDVWCVRVLTSVCVYVACVLSPSMGKAWQLNYLRSTFLLPPISHHTKPAALSPLKL